MFEIKKVDIKNIPKGIISFTTTRCCGYSEGRYQYLNFGFFNGDDLLNVNRNYNLLKKSLGINRVITLRQVHESNIVICDKNTPSFLKGDGFFTKAKGVATGILTADCFNVQLIGVDGALANLHCGWKSIYNGIIEKAVDLFGDEKIVLAVIGVGICENCFEVKEDFIEIVNKRDNVEEYILRKSSGYTFDIRSWIEKLLLKNGVAKKAIKHIRYCSSCDKRFYSYRRDKVTGRMISVLMRK